MAIRLHASGACRTKREASEAAGLHPAYLAMLTAPNGGSVPVKRLYDEIQRQIDDKTVETSAIIELLGRKALGKMAQLMDGSVSEHIQLKAAMDLADRAQSTSKTQKLQVESITISGQDAKALAAALVESNREREKYEHVIESGMVEIDVAQRPEIPVYAQEQTSKQEEPAPTEEIER